MISCEQPEVFAPNTVDETLSDATNQTSTITPPPTNSFNAEPFTDNEAILFLKDNCESCHNDKNGTYKSIWAFNSENNTKNSVLSDSKIVTAYTTMIKKIKKISDGKPAPMPPFISEEDTPKLQQMIDWLESNSAAVIHSSIFSEINKDKESPSTTINYQCSEKATVRQIIRRLMNDLFDREPTKDELKLVDSEILDLPVTNEIQKAIVDHIFNKDDLLKNDIRIKSLKKFADSLSGANGLEKLDGITNDQIIDLRDEFYQLLLNKVDSTPYKEILLTKEVYATNNTMQFYKDCLPKDNSNDKWFACNLKEPRDSYFGTVSFLNSAPTNFLTINNNYKRIKTAVYMIHGEIVESAADDDSGDITNPLPECFQSKDRRGTLGNDGSVAPYGSTSIPESGNFCQSCHIHQHMGAASVLFRPFSAGGLVYERQINIEDDPSFLNATSSDQVNVSGEDTLPVNKELLLDLMNLNGEKVCVIDNQIDSFESIDVKNIGELMRFLAKDETKIAAGLARHLPRAMSNLPRTSNELIEIISKAYQEHNGNLLPLMQKYFESETFSCARGTE